MDPAQPQPEPITDNAVVSHPHTSEPTTNQPRTTLFLATVNGRESRPAKRGRGRPRKKQTQPTEQRPVVLGLSESLLVKVEVRHEETISLGRSYKKQNVANGTPLLSILPAVNGTDMLKTRHGRPPKLSVFQSAAPDAHHVVPTKSELTTGGGHPGDLPVKRRGRPANSGPKKKMKNNVSQVAASDAASQSTMLNFECEILQKRMEIMRSRIKEAVGVLKSFIFTAENPSSSAMAAILELEQVAMDSRPPPLIDLNLHPDS